MITPHELPQLRRLQQAITEADETIIKLMQLTEANARHIDPLEIRKLIVRGEDLRKSLWNLEVCMKNDISAARASFGG